MASHRPYSWARYWSKAGHDVTVVCAKYGPAFDDLECDLHGFQLIQVPWLPSFLEGMYRRENNSKQRQEPATVVRRCVNGVVKIATRTLSQLQQRYGVLFAQRFPDVFFMWRKLAYRQLVKHQSWDVVVSTNGPYATHLLAYDLKRTGRVKSWVADYRDLWTDHHVYNGMWPFTIYERWLERRVLRSADAASTISEPLADCLRQRNPGLCVRTIENGFEEADLDLLAPEPYFPDDGIVRIVYTGWIQAGVRDPSALFQAISMLEQELQAKQSTPSANLPLEIVTVGPVSEVVAGIARQFNVEKYVRQLGFKTRSECLRIQRDAHILLFLEYQSTEHKGLLSGKIFEYVFAGTEIWAIGKEADDSVARMLDTSNAGKHFSTDVAAIKHELAVVTANTTKRMQQPNAKYLSTFTRKNRAEAMITLVEEVYTESVSNDGIAHC